MKGTVSANSGYKVASMLDSIQLIKSKGSGMSQLLMMSGHFFRLRGRRFRPFPSRSWARWGYAPPVV